MLTIPKSDFKTKPNTLKDLFSKPFGSCCGYGTGSYREKNLWTNTKKY
jgi:hypothetical protein